MLTAKPFRDPMHIVQGATLRILRTWKVGTPPMPVDLTGCTARMQVRATLESPDVLLELTTTNGGIILGDADGTITRFMSDTDTTALTWEDGVYDLEVEFPGGDVRRLLCGDVIVSREITRGGP